MTTKIVPKGRLTVIADGERILSGASKSYASKLCQCQCGNVVTVRSDHLKSGASRSCGCLKIEKTKLANTTHGATKGGRPTPEFVAWTAMKGRATNENGMAWKDYGGRGISVCERWQDFAAFIADVGPRPSPKHSIDRYPDNDGNYEPGNVRWATKSEQSSNRRSNVMMTFYGKTMNATRWSEISGVSMSLIMQRIRKLGWTEKAVVWTPVRKTTSAES